MESKPRPTGVMHRGYFVLYGHRDHPNSAKATGHIHEHVFVMSNHLGRPLRKGETVHHKNGIRNDNRIENLELWSHSHPYGQRVEDLKQFAADIISKYGMPEMEMPF